jgi:myo-inositol-1(or 4)-monophosphatase
MTMSEILGLARGAAHAGAAVLVAARPDQLHIQVKSSASDLVTDVDVAAERAIRQVIAEARPGDTIGGEELPRHHNIAAEYRWSIDPLDGTTNFVRGIPYYCSSVAVCAVRTGDWVAGAVVAPQLGMTYYAERGEGAWLETRRGTKRLRPRSDSAELRLVGTGFSYTPQIRLDQFEALPDLMSSYHDLRRFGSAALEICAVAEGALDAFYEDDLQEWDWAAAALIAEEAGLLVKRPQRGSSGPIHVVPAQD